VLLGNLLRGGGPPESDPETGPSRVLRYLTPEGVHVPGLHGTRHPSVKWGRDHGGHRVGSMRPKEGVVGIRRRKPRAFRIPSKFVQALRDEWRKIAPFEGAHATAEFEALLKARDPQAAHKLALARIRLSETDDRPEVLLDEVDTTRVLLELERERTSRRSRRQTAGKSRRRSR
jgi:hypothetical protein